MINFHDVYHKQKLCKIVIIFLSISLNMCFEYPQHMFWLRNKSVFRLHSYLRACVYTLFEHLHNTPVIAQFPMPTTCSVLCCNHLKHSVGPDLCLNCSTLLWYSRKNFLKKKMIWKKQKQKNSYQQSSTSYTAGKG